MKTRGFKIDVYLQEKKNKHKLPPNYNRISKRVFSCLVLLIHANEICNMIRF